jgi:hypothetical protein
MSKTWHFIKNSSSKTKTKSLVTARGHKENQNKNNQVVSRKALSYSYIARLTYLIIKMGEAHEGTCTLACPSSLGSVPCTFCVETETSHCLPSNQ